MPMPSFLEYMTRRTIPHGRRARLLLAMSVGMAGIVFYVWSYYGIARRRLGEGYELNYIQFRSNRIARVLYYAHSPLRRLDLWRLGRPTYYIGGPGSSPNCTFEDAPAFEGGRTTDASGNDS
jgi:hypothetical protein